MRKLPIPVKDGLSFAVIYAPIFIGVDYYLGDFAVTYMYLLEVILQVGITSVVFCVGKV